MMTQSGSQSHGGAVFLIEKGLFKTFFAFIQIEDACIALRAFPQFLPLSKAKERARLHVPRQ